MNLVTMSTSQAKEEGEEDEILAELAKKQTELKSVVSWPTGCAVSLTSGPLAVPCH